MPPTVFSALVVSVLWYNLSHRQYNWKALGTHDICLLNSNMVISAVFHRFLE